MNDSLILLMFVLAIGAVLGMYLGLRATRPPTTDRERERRSHEREVNATFSLVRELLVLLTRDSEGRPWVDADPCDCQTTPRRSVEAQEAAVTN